MDLARRAKSIFLDALDAPAHERDAFVARECADDTSLRARVDALLAAHVRAESAGLTLAPVPAAPHDPEGVAGARIGPYELQRELGTGGFGAVWLARQLEPIERPVALKLLKAGMDTREVIARFALERRALARMEHPGIARILDAGATPLGRPWFAMEHVDGPPITVHADRAGLSTRERVELFIPLCRAVHHAHQKGVVHRDIKPTNVLVAVAEGRAAPKVIDFGIAKAVAGDLAEHHTRADQIVGTPASMAPEQLTGDGDVDTRADVYGLGALLYELLAGVPPHELETSTPNGRPRSASAIRELVLASHPRRPSVRLAEREEREPNASTARPGPRARDLRGELDWIVMRCLERDRERRYDSVASLAADLERYLAGQTVLAGPPSLAYRTSRFVRRHRRPLAAVATLFIALVAALVLIENEADRARDAELLAKGETTRALAAEALATSEAERARLAEQAAKDELVRADAVARFLEDLLLSVDPATAQGRDTSLLVEMLARSEKHIAAQQSNLRPDVEASLRRIVGGAYFTLARFAEAEPHLERALALRRQHLGDLHADTLQSESEYAALLLDIGRPEECRELLASTFEHHRTVFGERDERTLDVQANLGTLLQQLGHSREAEPLLREIEAIRIALHGRDDERTVLAENNLALLLDELGDYDGALERYRHAYAHNLATEGPAHPRTLTAANNLANMLENVGALDEAAELHEHTLAVKREVFPPGHPSLVASLNNIAALRDSLDAHAEAEALRLEALSSAEEFLGPTHRSTLTVRYTHAAQLVELERAADALPHLEALVTLAPEHLGAEHPVTLASISLYGWALHQLGRTAEAEPHVAHTANHALAHEPPGSRARAITLARAYLVRAALPADALTPLTQPITLASVRAECEAAEAQSYVERLDALAPPD
jgi:serine/threonine protein kinase